MPRRALVAWELGDNLGHVAPLAPVVRALAAAGWEVHVAVQRLDVAARFFGEAVTGWHQAPLWPHDPAEASVPVTWADLVRPFGWARAADLAVLLRAWSSLLRAVDPEVVLADAAPTAVLAARGVRVLQVTHGFSLPPLTIPLPPLRWWAPPPPGWEAREATVLAAVQGASRALGRRAPEHLAGAVAHAERWCQGTAATDAYGPVRPEGDVRYLGPTAALTEGAPPRWPPGDGPKVFAYLDARHPALRPILAALAGSGARVHAYVRGLPAPAARELPAIAFADGPARIGRVRAEADAAVCHSAAGTGSAFLAAGVPTLLLPMHLEQEMAARAAVAAGGARMVLPTREADWAGGLAAALSPAAKAEAEALSRWAGPTAAEALIAAL